MLDPFSVIMWSFLGLGVGIALSWIPGFHIYNIIALITVIAPIYTIMPIEAFPYFALGALVAFVYLSAIQTVYLSVADESFIFMLFPTQRYLALGRGHEALWLVTLGTIGGTIILVTFGLAVAPYIISPLYAMLSPYTVWFLILIVVFMFMSEWQKMGDREKNPWKRLLVAWSQNIGGIIVFFASGLLGFIIMNTGVVPAEFAYVRLTPMFIGFFGMPWVLQNIFSRVYLPRQKTEDVVEASPYHIINGTISGAFGGSIAAFFPIITGGMGALVAGHMVSTRGDDTFIVSQGSNRILYYVGAFFLLFIPTTTLRRGAGAQLVSSIYVPKTWTEFYYAAGVILLAAGISLLGVTYLSKLVSRIVTGQNYVKVSMVVAGLLVLISYVLAGWQGVVVLFVATMIGLAAVVFNTRRSYCLGGIIFPIAVSMTGNTQVLLSLLQLTPTL